MCGGWGYVDHKKGRINADIVLKEKYGEKFRSFISNLGKEKSIESRKNKRINDPLWKELERQRLVSFHHLANTEKAKEKRKNTLKEIGHQQGEKILIMEICG